ncbi:bifunctional DNA primase/polymerase [uncultured Pseudokineococcus sp.]|uniref:bifunctional DNA primase/polymerase n=1 Tax=uncultured Pseudokineococcus sp. TaxID=1642928 RepID=UPI002632FF5C|nr:bifunctional DNA primase/polymerase [uncultured Pseudokineococcus sp.]
MTGPYADAARAYLAAGWNPVPLPYARKSPVPAGVTGWRGLNVNERMVEAWSRLGRRNIAVRAPETVIGIDADLYKDEGAATFAEAAERLGPLPDTFRSTARADGSGIYWFRVPPGRRWRAELGAGVEVVQWGHRYGVVGPSVHPDLAVEYEWVDPEGLPMGGPPHVDELPALPPEWVAELDNGSVADVDAKADVSDVSAWTDGLASGSPCQAMSKPLGGALAALEADAPGSRHGTMARAQLALVRMGEQGHAGAPAALEQLETAFSGAVAGSRDGGEAEARREWERALAGAVAIASAQATPEGDRGCCPERSSPAEDFAAAWGDVLDSTPVLAHIKQAAHARYLSAPALLAYVLGRVLVEVPPDVLLPATVGSEAPLNLAVAVVGGSGDGKSALFDVSRELLGLRGMAQEERERVAGSGEGLVNTFLRWDKTSKTNVLADDPVRIVSVDEIDQLGAIQSRSGATLAPVLRSALMGGALGSENADAERRRRVPAKSYRLVLFAGVQPTRSAALLDDADAGTPQRFVWVRASDPTIPDHTEWPGELGWAPVETPKSIDYPEAVKAEVRAARLARARGTGDELAGHVNLTRLKVGAALALLHGETYISERWWGLAGQMVDASRAVQEQCRAVLAAEGQKRHAGAAIAAARAEEAVDDDKVARAARHVLKRVKEAAGEWVSRQDARHPTKSLREYTDDAIASLRRAGQVEVEEYESRGQTCVRLRLAEGAA